LAPLVQLRLGVGLLDGVGGRQEEVVEGLAVPVEGGPVADGGLLVAGEQAAPLRLLAAQREVAVAVGALHAAAVERVEAGHVLDVLEVAVAGAQQLHPLALLVHGRPAASHMHMCTDKVVLVKGKL